MTDIQPLPTARQTGHIIANTVLHFPLDGFLQHCDASLTEVAQVPIGEIRARYVLLMLGAALHAIEHSQFNASIENELAAGLFEKAKLSADANLLRLLPNLDDLTDAFSDAAADDVKAPAPIGEFSQIELEFFDHLMALGSGSDTRVQACIQIAAVLPRELWQVQQEATVQNLRRAGLLAPLDA
jgi:hypothetical protein